MSELESIHSATQISDARERILVAAEGLFSARGFASVTLRDIAAPLGLKHSSIYHHFPGGKDELFVSVLERSIRRHGEGLAAAIVASDGSLRGKVRGIASWLLSQPPMDLLRMAKSDFQALPSESAARISGLMYTEVIRRLQSVFEDAQSSGEVCDCDPGLLAGGLIGFVESLHAAPESQVGRSRLDMAYALIDVLLKGIEYRAPGGKPCRS